MVELRTLGWAAIGTLALAVAIPGVARAGAGDANAGFGTGGTLTIDFTGTEDQLGGIARQPDGRIVGVGSTLIANQFGAKDPALVRILPNGAPDPSFGIGGRVTMHWPQSFFSILVGVRIQPDGKILASGWSDSNVPATESFNQQFALARFNTDGSPDTSFGNGGLVVTDLNQYYDFAFGVALQADGKIVVAGTEWYGNGYRDPTSFAVVRYNADGTLDTAFGTNGIATTKVAGRESVGFALAIDASQRIVVGGWVLDNSAFGTSSGLARFLPDGTLDATFGDGGTVVTDLVDVGYTDDELAALTLQPDGDIVVAGRTTPATDDPEGMLVMRYDDTGTLDATFGDGGVVNVMFDGFDAEAYAIAVDKQGSLVVGGQAGALGFGTVDGMAFSVDTQGVASTFALARLLPNGALDASFGNGGRVTTHFDGDDGLSDVIGAIDPNAGGLLAAGFVRSSNHAMSTFESNADFAFSRYDDGYPIFVDGFDPPRPPGKRPPYVAPTLGGGPRADLSKTIAWTSIRDVACTLFCTHGTAQPRQPAR
jgi:uncharacterized delta-60 repeat protein